MTDPKLGEGTRAALDAEIARLKEHAAKSVSPCDVAKLIAVSDDQVLDRLRARVQSGDVPRGVSCIGADGVLFRFTCAPGAICLVPRSFLVLVDLATRKVREIIDPFDPDDLVQSSAIGMSRASLPVPRPTSMSGAISDASRRIMAVLRPATRNAAARPTVPAASGPQAFAVASATSYTLTVEVTGVTFKALLFGSTQFDFFGSDRLDVTLPTAGTYQFDLMVRDFAHRTFRFKVSTSSGASLEQSAETDDEGANLLRLQVTVP
jgi:hypothetical protein